MDKEFHEGCSGSKTKPNNIFIQLMVTVFLFTGVFDLSGFFYKLFVHVSFTSKLAVGSAPPPHPGLGDISHTVEI